MTLLSHPSADASVTALADRMVTAAKSEPARPLPLDRHGTDVFVRLLRQALAGAARAECAMTMQKPAPTPPPTPAPAPTQFLTRDCYSPLSDVLVISHARGKVPLAPWKLRALKAMRNRSRPGLVVRLLIWWSYWLKGLF